MATMLDPDIQRLLDTVFNVPVGAEAPGVHCSTMELIREPAR